MIIRLDAFISYNDPSVLGDGFIAVRHVFIDANCP
jgi:hypothetical protein